MSSDTHKHCPVLLIFADSLAYYGPQGGLPADDPRIWPNIVAQHINWKVELIARIGWTSRDMWWALTQDPRAWAAIGQAGAVIIGISGMDSMPSVLPTSLRELIRYLRPPALRRKVRTHYGWLQQHFSRWAPPALPPELTVHYLEATRAAINYSRPGLPIIATLPATHHASSYGYAHQSRITTTQAVAQWATRNQLPTVDLYSAVKDEILHDRGNPDGIHWNFITHQIVARNMIDALQSCGIPANL